jgi:hypothetical protein
MEELVYDKKVSYFYQYLPEHAILLSIWFQQRDTAQYVFDASMLQISMCL